MSRNGAGTYTLPSNSFNPAVASTTISATSWNATANDLATALTYSIASDGQTPTTVRIPFAQGILTNAGTVTNPAINFTSNLTTGFYLAGTASPAIAAGGVQAMVFTSTGATIPGTLAVNGALSGPTISSINSSLSAGVTSISSINSVLSGQSTSLAAISSSLSSTNSTVASVSSSLTGVSSSLSTTNVTVAAVSSSLSSTNSTVTNVSTSTTNISSSLSSTNSTNVTQSTSLSQISSSLSSTASTVTVISTAQPTGAVVGTTDTQTLTNKRITKRIQTVTTGTTITPTSDTCDQYNVTALASGATIAAPTGTPTDGQALIIRIQDNGTARALTWNGAYVAQGVTLATTTVISTPLYTGAIWNAQTSKWDVLAVS